MDGHEKAIGIGSSKREAEQQAAKTAMLTL